MEKSLSIFAQLQSQLVAQGIAPRPPMTTAKSILHEVKWVPVTVADADANADTISSAAAAGNFTAIALAPPPFLGGAAAEHVPPPVRLNAQHIAAFKNDLLGLVIVGGCADTLASSEVECCSLLALLQQFVADGAAGRLTLVVPAHINGGMLVGLTKALTLEHPDIACQRILYDRADQPLQDTELLALLDAGRAHHLQSDIWVHTVGRRTRSRQVVLTQQIVPVELTSEAADPNHVFAAEEDAVYIVTGGTGGIGQVLITWLVEVQNVPAAQVVAMCRNTGSDGARALQAQGVVTVGVDISDAVAVASCSALNGLTNVRGVFHLAGVLDDGLVSNMTPDRIRGVAAPKVDGLFALLGHAKSLDWDLDFALVFSSTSSLFGYPGQTNYCAANAVLDQYTDTHTEDFNVVAVNWGPWGEAGMASPGTKAHAQALRDGDTPLSNKDALAALNVILARACEIPAPTRRYAVCDVQWLASPWRDLPIVRTLAQKLQRINPGIATPRTSTGSTSMIGTPALPVPASSAGGLAEQLLRSMIPRWAPGESLNAAGMDSLDIVQLRNTVNRSVGKQVSQAHIT